MERFGRRDIPPRHRESRRDRVAPVPGAQAHPAAARLRDSAVVRPAGTNNLEAGRPRLVAEVVADTRFLRRPVPGQNALEPRRTDGLQDLAIAAPQAAVHRLGVLPRLVVVHTVLAGHEGAFGLEERLGLLAGAYVPVGEDEVIAIARKRQLLNRRIVGAFDEPLAVPLNAAELVRHPPDDQLRRDQSVRPGRDQQHRLGRLDSHFDISPCFCP